jgi:hypothetical protein
VSPFYSPATGSVPCAAMWFDSRAIGRTVWRGGYLQDPHDGWRTCTHPGAELVAVDGIPRLVCAEHARQVRAAITAGLAGQLRWQQHTGGTP